MAFEFIKILSNCLDENFSIRKDTEFYHQYQKLLATGMLEDSLTNKPPRNYSTEKYI